MTFFRIGTILVGVLCAVGVVLLLVIQPWSTPLYDGEGVLVPEMPQTLEPSSVVGESPSSTRDVHSNPSPSRTPKGVATYTSRTVRTDAVIRGTPQLATVTLEDINSSSSDSGGELTIGDQDGVWDGESGLEATTTPQEARE